MKPQKKKDSEKKSLKQIRSTQIFSPILDVKNGIIVTKDGRYVKLMEFSPINFNLRSSSEKDTIIDQFTSVIRTLPNTVQLKVVSQRADTSEYIDKIIDHAQKETNRGCLRLMEDQANLISSLSQTQGISRRFFLSFAYEDTRGLQKKPSFSQIENELSQQAYAISSGLNVCGNEQLSIDCDNEYTLSTLYSLFSRSEAEHVPYEQRELEVVSRYAASPNIDFDQEIHIPINDLICPNAIDTSSSKYIVVDDTYYMFCYLPSASYPSLALGGWLSVLINLGEGVDVDFWFHKEDVTTTKRILDMKIKDNRSKANTSDDSAPGYEETVQALNSGWYIKEGLASGEDLYYMSTMLTITAKSEKELMAKYEDIKKYCLRCDLEIKPCKYQQEAAFISSLPLAKYDPDIWKKSRRNVLTSSLAASYPFVSYEMSDENGILLGTNAHNGSLVFIDNFDTKKYFNANMAILGSSGSGKTYTLLTTALRMRQQGTQVFIIAPFKGFEFENACKAVGGAFITIEPGNKNNINIMEIRKREVVDESLYGGSKNTSRLIEKIQQLHRFFSIALKDITFEEDQILDEAMLKTYERFGINHKNKSLNDPKHPERYRPMPTLADLSQTLEQMGEPAKRLHSLLALYVTGSSKSFSLPTNVNLDNKFVVLDVSNLTEDMLPIGMFIAYDYVWDKSRADKTSRKAIFMDELWKLIGPGSSPLAATFVLEIFKAIRGYGGSAIAATQDLKDLFALNDGIYGSGIINNSKIKILMKTEPREVEELQKVLELTVSEAEQIKKAQRGHCLLIANSNHIFVNVKASPLEHNLITTDPNENRRLAQAKWQ